MKVLLLSMVLLMGCGGKALLPDDLPAPGFSWSPLIGLVITATDIPNHYLVEIDCRTELDFETAKVSDDLYFPCDVAGIEGKAIIGVTKQQLADFFEYKKGYLDRK